MPEVWTTIPFDDISTLELVTAEWLSDLANNTRFLREVAYNQSTATTAITATTEGTANAVVTGTTVTYEAVPHLIEFFVPQARPDTGAAGRNLHITLFDSTTALGELALLQTPAAAAMNQPIFAQYRLTPTAASHTYNVKAWVGAGTGSIVCGSGGAATNLPGFLRVTRIPT